MSDDILGVVFRRRVIQVLIVSVTVTLVSLLVFVYSQLFFKEAEPHTWLMRLIKQRYAALIQVPINAGLAFGLVCVLEIVSGEKIEFEILGSKFSGASGPVVLWVFVFMVVTLATYLLWPLPGVLT